MSCDDRDDWGKTPWLRISMAKYRITVEVNNGLKESEDVIRKEAAAALLSTVKTPDFISSISKD